MSRLVVAIGHVEFTLANQTLYVVNVQQDADEWEVRRTYSEFRKLRDDVLRVMSRQDDPSSLEFARAVDATPFPHKRLFGSRKDRVVKERAVELHHFLIKLLLLTHTYRKAQKTQLSENESEQASASVFFLLRDFLKPLGAAHANAASSASATATGEHDEASQRVIRESKMLAMRSSAGNTTATNMTRSAHDSPPPPAQAPVVKAPAQMLRLESSIPILEEEPPPQRKKTLSIGALTHRARRTVSSASSQQQPQHDNRSRQDSNASNTSYYSTDSSRKPSNAASEPDAAAHGGSSYTATSSVPMAIPSSSSPPSSSTASTVLSSSTSSMPSRSKSNYNNETQSRLYTDENRTFSSSAIEGRRAKSKHASSSSSHARSKPRSISTKELRTSERKSKLSPQLAVQAISIQAQKELERYVSEYSAIMILRYVDRFINKAVMKTPGPYTVQNERLVIDSERFYEELDDMFKDLPASFESNFKNVVGEWRFPLALDAYVQMKWNSFQECRSAPNSSTMNTSSTGSTSYRSTANKKSGRRNHRKADSDSDDDSESEYEYIGGGGYMKPKKVFTDEEADVLDKMIAEGTAGKDQMLRLRRQMNEQGWNRRENPSGIGHFSSSFTKKTKGGVSTHEYWTDTDDDDHRQTGSSGGEEATIEHYQQKYNALRKERLSRREGGLVNDDGVTRELKSAGESRVAGPRMVPNDKITGQRPVIPLVAETYVLTIDPTILENLQRAMRIRSPRRDHVHRVALAFASVCLDTARALYDAHRDRGAGQTRLLRALRCRSPELRGERWEPSRRCVFAADNVMRSCTVNWSTHPFPFATPVDVNCGASPAVYQGAASYSPTRAGATVRYSCIKGCVMSGSATATCTKHGTWSNQPPECRVEYTTKNDNTYKNGDKGYVLYSG